jgi:hypothetical protein
MNNESSTWAEVGLGLNRQFRDFLARLRLSDPSLRWHEGRGFITRRYEIVGRESSITRVRRTLMAWQEKR